LDKIAIEDLFAPVGRVTIRKMFGGYGIYHNQLFIALSHDGMIWLKTDENTCPAFERAGSRAFQYMKKQGGVAVMSFWLLPEICFDDEEELKRFVALAHSAAMRTIASKSGKKSGSAKTKNTPSG
jgi:DNA transformation protein and related proteins